VKGAAEPLLFSWPFLDREARVPKTTFPAAVDSNVIVVGAAIAGETEIGISGIREKLETKATMRDTRLTLRSIVWVSVGIGT
jgi:hypothetical protein